jgi:hypothetical protein
MAPNTAPEDIKQVLQRLAATPRRIASVSKGCTPAQLHYRPDEEIWSANDILAHLRACADVWGKSILVMIAQDHPTLRYVSPRTWIRKTDYPELAFVASLTMFTKQRQALVEALKALTPQDWSRGATFTATTRGREQTILSYAQRIVGHEQAHCEQIETLLPKVSI